MALTVKPPFRSRAEQLPALAAGPPARRPIFIAAALIAAAAAPPARSDQSLLLAAFRSPRRRPGDFGASVGDSRPDSDQQPSEAETLKPWDEQAQHLATRIWLFTSSGSS